METKSILLKKAGKSIEIDATFKHLEEADRTLKSAIAILEVSVDSELVDVEVKWDSFEGEYSLESDGNKSHRDLERALLACFSEEQLTTPEGSHTDLYYDLVNYCMGKISRIICDFAEGQIYDTF